MSTATPPAPEDRPGSDAPERRDMPVAEPDGDAPPDSPALAQNAAALAGMVLADQRVVGDLWHGKPLYCGWSRAPACPMGACLVSGCHFELPAGHGSSTDLLRA